MAVGFRRLDDILIIFAASFGATLLAKAAFNYLNYKGLLPSWATTGAPIPDIFTIDANGYVRWTPR